MWVALSMHHYGIITSSSCGFLSRPAIGRFAGPSDEQSAVCPTLLGPSDMRRTIDGHTDGRRHKVVLSEGWSVGLSDGRSVGQSDGLFGGPFVGRCGAIV